MNTEFGPLKFFTVYKVTDLLVDDLNPSVRAQVVDGITARSEHDAENIVRNLRQQQLPVVHLDARRRRHRLRTTATPTSVDVRPTSRPARRATRRRRDPHERDTDDRDRELDAAPRPRRRTTTPASRP